MWPYHTLVLHDQGKSVNEFLETAVSSVLLLTSTFGGRRDTVIYTVM